MHECKHEVMIQSDFEKIIKAITTREGLSSWWTSDVEAHPKPGTTAKFGFYNREVVFTMKVDKITQESVEWSCVDGPDEWVGTKQKFSLLQAEKGSTLLRFVHSGWKSDSGSYPRCNTTWGHLMILLRNYVEGKSSEPFFK